MSEGDNVGTVDDSTIRGDDVGSLGDGLIREDDVERLDVGIIREDDMGGSSNCSPTHRVYVSKVAERLYIQLHGTSLKHTDKPQVLGTG